MDKRAKLLAALRSLTPPATADVWQGTVTAVDGMTCSVELTSSDLTIEGVQLIADEEQTGFVLTPAVGSRVLVGLIEGELADLFIIQYSQVDKLTAQIGDTSLTLDSQGATLVLGDNQISVADSGVQIKQQEAEVSVSSGKVTIKNATTSLAEVIDDVATLLQKYQVICAAPGSPSAPFPASVASAAQLAVKAKTLLQ